MELKGLSLDDKRINDLISLSKEKEKEYYNWLINDYGFDNQGDYSSGRLKLLLQTFFSHKGDDAALRKLFKSQTSEQKILDIVEQAVGDFIEPTGLGDLARMIVQSTIRNEYQQQAGNITELIDMVKLGKHLQKQGLFNVSIVDTTASVGNGEDVKFDFAIGIQIGNSSGANGSNLINKIPFEVKSGINGDPLFDQFDFGQFSSGAFYKRPEVYEELQGNIEVAIINAMQDDLFYGNKQYIEIKEVDLIRMFAVEYIEWRLRNNIPFFIGNNGVLLCSEVLEYMNNYNKTYITTDLRDFRIDDVWLTDPQTYDLEIDQDKIYREIIKQVRQFNVKIGYGRLHS